MRFEKKVSACRPVFGSALAKTGRDRAPPVSRRKNSRDDWPPERACTAVRDGRFMRLHDQNREIARDHRIIISAPSLLVFMHPSFGSALR